MKRPSIKRRLMMWTSLITTVILIACAFLLWGYMKRLLYQQFDRLLNDAATLAMIEVEVKDSKVYHEWQESLEEIRSNDGQPFIQVWDFNSGETTRSKALGKSNLELKFGKLNERVFYDTLLPNGEKGRAIGVLMTPRIEYKEGNEGFDPNKHPQVFVWAESSKHIENVLSNTYKMFIFGGVITILAIWGAIWLVVCLSSKAVVRLTEDVMQREGDRLGEVIPVPPSLPEEMAVLAQKFNLLLAKISELSKRDREFYLNIAHEIRTPLAGLHAINEQALRQPRENADYKRRFEEAFQETTALNNMVSRLLQMGRLRRKGKEYKHSTVDIHFMLKRIVRTYEQRMTERNLQVEWQLGACGEISTDEELVKIVLSNLIENAVSYAAEGSGIILRTFDEGDHLHILVDNALVETIDQKDASEFFEPFYRADKARGTAGNHVGIGLSFSRELVELLGGTLDCGVPISNRIIFEVILPRPNSAA